MVVHSSSWDGSPAVLIHVLAEVFQNLLEVTQQLQTTPQQSVIRGVKQSNGVLDGSGLILWIKSSLSLPRKEHCLQPHAEAKILVGALIYIEKQQSTSPWRCHKPPPCVLTWQRTHDSLDTTMHGVEQRRGQDSYCAVAATRQLIRSLCDASGLRDPWLTVSRSIGSNNRPVILARISVVAAIVIALVATPVVALVVATVLLNLSEALTIRRVIGQDD